MSLIFVDCEDIDVVKHSMREFGAVEFKSRATFHGKDDSYKTFKSFEDWLIRFKGRPIFVSDNPAYDWQGINYGFLKHLGHNPFGHSARRISDFYAGLIGNFYETQGWKKLRITKHTHHPVDDAMGNCEAFQRLLNGELP